MTNIIETIAKLAVTMASVVTVGCGSIDTSTIEPEGFKFANLLPNTEEMFGIEHMLILDDDGGNYYIFEVDTVTQEQYESFLSGCKEKGFVISTYESLDKMGGYYGAYTADGKYWVELFWDMETQKMNVCCNKSNRYEELIGSKEAE